MNAWRKQSPNACLAYSLWYIGAIDDEALAQYEMEANLGLLTMGWIKQYLANYAPWCDPSANPSTRILDYREIDSVKSGVAIFAWGHYQAHAVAIINGRILDPEGRGTLQTVEEFTATIQTRTPVMLTAVSEFLSN